MARRSSACWSSRPPTAPTEPSYDGGTPQPAAFLPQGIGRSKAVEIAVFPGPGQLLNRIRHEPPAAVPHQSGGFQSTRPHRSRQGNPWPGCLTPSLFEPCQIRENRGLASLSQGAALKLPSAHSVSRAAVDRVACPQCSRPPRVPLYLRRCGVRVLRATARSSTQWHGRRASRRASAPRDPSHPGSTSPCP